MFNALTCRVAEEYLWSRIFIPLQVVIERNIAKDTVTMTAWNVFCIQQNNQLKKSPHK